MRAYNRTPQTKLTNLFVVGKLLTIVSSNDVCNLAESSRQIDRGQENIYCTLTVYLRRQGKLRHALNARHQCTTMSLTYDGVDFTIANSYLIIDYRGSVISTNSLLYLASGGLAIAALVVLFTLVCQIGIQRSYRDALSACHLTNSQVVGQQ